MTAGKHGRPWLRWLVWWALLFGVWCLLVAKVSPDNLIAAAIVAAVAAAAAAAVRRAGVIPLAWPRGWPGAAMRVPAQVLRDTAIVFSALRGAAHGRMTTVPFDTAGDDPASCTRRALAVFLICLSPNTVVTSIDRQNGALRIHQLVPTPDTPGHGNKEWPV